MGFTVMIGDDFSLRETKTYGRAIGNRRILRALARIDSVEHILLPGNAPTSSTGCAYLDAKILGVPNAAEVCERLGRDEVHAIVCSDFVSKYPSWLELRNHSGSTAPVLGITHSLSYQRFTGSIFHLLTAGARANDTILCSSVSGRDVVERLLESVSKTLAGEPSWPRLELFPHPLESPGLEREQRQIKWSKNDFHIVYLGRLDWRNKADLLPLLALAPSLPPQVRMTIAGAVDDRAYVEMLQKMAAGLPIEFRFDLHEADKWELLESAHALFSPADNYQETYGLSIIEAMSVGCVPIVSDFDGYRDLVKHGSTGLTFATVGARMPERLRSLQGIVDEIVYHGWWAAGVSYDLNDVVRLIGSVVEDEQEWTRLSEHAFLAAKDYSVSQSASRLENILFRDKPCDTASPTTFSPFNWCPHVLFEKHPTEFWGDQSMEVTELGRNYLNRPRLLLQMQLLAGEITPREIYHCLSSFVRQPRVRIFLDSGGKELTLSLCLKNGFLTSK